MSSSSSSSISSEPETSSVLRVNGTLTNLAYDQHRSVPADRWCVTYSDLAFLRQMVREAIESGQIQLEADEDAEAYGPSIYTVNEQFIKPVTLEAGKVSWALMQHPDGLDCDLFISHAWQEGVFEFLSKVTYSWPWGLRTAWCCMLANPQNLNISSFLESPANSPFAVALRASKVMLVVPNRHQSVYTRLWCAYEAYLALEEGKTILIAHSSRFPEILTALRWIILAAIIGAALGLTSTFLGVGGPYGASVLALLLMAFSLVMQDETFRWIMHLVGQMLCWILATHRAGWVFKAEEKREDGMPFYMDYTLHVCYWLNISLAFCFMEVDRIQARSTVLEAKELQQGYRGSIQYAKCSQETDERSIRGEIANQVNHVDHAIHVLLTAGMSTPALRDIARMVRVEHAAFSEVTAAVFLLGPVAIAGFAVAFWNGVMVGQPAYPGALVGISVLSRLILVLLLFRSHWDEQRYILKIMGKFLAMYFWIYVIVVVFALIFRDLSVGGAALLWLLVGDICSMSVLSFAILGLRGLANLPLGVTVLRILFSRGSNALDAVSVFIRCSSDTSSESAADSDDSGGSGH